MLEYGPGCPVAIREDVHDSEAASADGQVLEHGRVADPVHSRLTFFVARTRKDPKDVLARIAFHEVRAEVPAVVRKLEDITHGDFIAPALDCGDGARSFDLHRFRNQLDARMHGAFRAARE
jgi:hypothetical protein